MKNTNLQTVHGNLLDLDLRCTPPFAVVAPLELVPVSCDLDDDDDEEDEGGGAELRR